MTTDIISSHLPSYSLSEQAFLDAENLDEQNLAEEYLNLCSAVEEECRTYLRTHPSDIAAGCRYFAARAVWSRDAWIDADHDQKIRMIEDQTDIMQHIDFCKPHQNAKIRQIIRKCQTFIGQLRWIRNAVRFDMGDESAWEEEICLW